MPDQHSAGSWLDATSGSGTAVLTFFSVNRSERLDQGVSKIINREIFVPERS